LRNLRANLALIALVILGLACLGGLLWANYRFVTHFDAGGHFLPRWAGTQWFVKDGISPYSDEAVRGLQELVLGRRPRPNDPPVFYLFPFYAFVVYLPFSLITDFELATAVWMTALEAALLAAGVVSISLSRWRPSRPLLAAFLLFSVLWYFGGRALINGHVVILTSLMVLLALLAIRAGHDVLAGFLLALSTITPQVVFLLILFVIIWALSARRGGIAASFVVSLLFFLFSTLLFFPDWLAAYARQVLVYLVVLAPPSAPGGVLFRSLPGIGRQIGWGLTVFSLGLLFWEWRLARGAEMRHFFWTACLTIVVSSLTGIPTSPDHYVMMLPALALSMEVWDERWGALGKTLIVLSLLVFTAGLWGLAWQGAVSGYRAIHNLLNFFLLPFYLLASLYWVRWWALRPPRLPLEEAAAQEML
jgi:hypothetical protein